MKIQITIKKKLKMKKRIFSKALSAFALAQMINAISFAQPTGTSLLFNGINNYVNVPDNSALDFTDSLSMEAWINVGSDSNQHIITKGWCLNQNYAYYVGIDTGKISFGWDPNGNCGAGANVVRTDSVVIQPYQCTHVAVIFDTALVSIYINGVIVPSSLVLGNYMPIYNSSQPMRIGTYRRLDGTLSGYLDGEIDELRLWNYKLSVTEIVSRMNTTLTGNEPGLVAYYDFEEPGTGAGFTVLNQCAATGSALNGLSYGSATTPSHIPLCATVGIEEGETGANVISVYPNPSTGTFTIDLGNSFDAKEHSIIIRNILSQIVFETKTQQQKVEVRLKDVAESGIYFLEIRDEQNRIVNCRKIIVE